MGFNQGPKSQLKQMKTQQNLEQAGNSISQKITHLIKKIKPVHVLYAIIPLIFFYPKPFLKLLKPFINNWSYQYRKINSVANQPLEIILIANQNISFTKEYIKKIKVVKGQLPQAFIKIQQSLVWEQQIKQSQNNSMKQAIIAKKHQFQRQKIFKSCYVIDMHNLHQTQLKLNIQTQITSMRKNSHTQLFNSTKQQTKQGMYSQIDFVWLQLIQMKLKILKLENNSEVIKHVIIKANQKILKLLQTKILGLSFKQTFKLKSLGNNKIHTLKLNKNLNTYEQCEAIFKIQQNQS